MARTTDDAPSITVEFAFYVQFRDAVGQKRLVREVPEGTTFGEVLGRLADRYPELEGELVTEAGELADGVRALRNGRERAGGDTRLEDGDEVSLMTPIHGGAT
jgi:MoaD family protein